MFVTKRNVKHAGSIQTEIEYRIKSKRRGTIFHAGDFKDIGSIGSVKMALSRLAKERIVTRLGQGIYLYPKIDPELGAISASIEDVVRVIARRDRARVIPTGASALNRLGLSTQVPLRFVYLTDGSPRKIQLGSRIIHFKRTSARNLAMKGKISTLAVLALQELGIASVTTNVKVVIATALSHESPALLEHDLRLAPQWVAKVIREAMNEPNG
jgi:predicted transcriptional regulator of viral defense system